MVTRQEKYNVLEERRKVDVIIATPDEIWPYITPGISGTTTNIDHNTVGLTSVALAGRNLIPGYSDVTSHNLKGWQPSTEVSPDGKAPNTDGVKLDAGKSPVFRGLIDYFPRACLAVAEVSECGARKYKWKGWQAVPDGETRYQDALVRHICKESIEGPIDKDFGLLHSAHVAWNALAVLELKLRATHENKG